MRVNLRIDESVIGEFISDCSEQQPNPPTADLPMTTYEPIDPSDIRPVDPDADYTPIQKLEHDYEEVAATVPVRNDHLIPNPVYLS